MRRLFTLLALCLLGGASFTQVVNLPYLQTFTGFPVDDVTFGPGAEPNAFPMGWVNVQTGDDAQDWYGRTVATGSSNTGPAADHTTGSGVYVFVEDGWGNYTNVALESPPIDLVGVGAVEMSYWVHSYTTAGTSNTMVVDIHNGTNWVLGIDSLGNLGIDAWQQRMVNLSPYAGDTVVIRFRGKNNVTSFEHDIAIDDFNVYATTITASIGTPVWPSCNGFADGSLTASASYATPPLTFLWSNGQTTATATNLTAGNYCVTVTDSLGDTSSTCFTLGEPTAITWNTVVTNPVICDGDSNAAITLDSLQGGTPYPVGCGILPSIVCGGVDDTLQIGNGATLNGNTSYPAAFGNWYWGARQQFLFRASELMAAGVQPGLLKGVGFNVSANAGTTSYTGYTLSMSCTTDSVLSATWISGLDQVKAPVTYTVALGWNYITFDDEFYWNGTDNIVLETCFNNSSYTYNTEGPFTTTSFVSCHYYRADASGVCGNNSNSGTSSDRPNIRFMNCAATGPQAYTATWSNGDSALSSMNLPAGTYTVMFADQNGCMAADTTTILSTAPVSLPDAGFCDGTMATLDAGANYVSYMWSTGDSTQTIMTNTPGSYAVDVVDSIGCNYSDSMTLVQNANPSVSLGADQTVCEEVTPVTLDAGAGFTYAWSDGSANQTLDVTASGSYSVEITDSNGCMGMDTVTITVNPSPVVSLGSDTLICEDNVPFTLDAGNAGATFAWSTGATTQTISISASGTYTVTVTNANGCEGMDDIAITVDICTGILDPASALMTEVYPNPAQQFVNVALTNAVPGVVEVKVLDLNGRMLFNQQQDNLGNATVLKLDLQSLSHGVYFLQVTNGGKQSIHRITVQ